MFSCLPILCGLLFPLKGERKFKIELQFSVSDIDLNNLYLKTPGGVGGEQPSCNVKIQIAIQKTRKGDRCLPKITYFCIAICTSK